MAISTTLRGEGLNIPEANRADAGGRFMRIREDCPDNINDCEQVRRWTLGWEGSDGGCGDIKLIAMVQREPWARSRMGWGGLASPI